MKKSRFTNSEIDEVLRRVEADLGVPGVCLAYGISSVAFYMWRSRFCGMDRSMMTRKKELELLKRRQSIESTIRNLKQDYWMGRCRLHGETGDQIHAALDAAGYNLGGCCG
jgi:putative transposase